MFNCMKMQMKIQFILFTLLFTLLIHFMKISVNSVNINNVRLRNTMLRIYIASDKKEILKDYYKKLLYKSKAIVLKKKENIVSKIYELNMIYNNLTDEEKDFLEFILSLCY